MCGIVGYVGSRRAAPILVEGLRRLEYRGYDSAGIATLENGQIECMRAEGKLRNLILELDQTPLFGTIGVGHTRWATHGAATLRNAHPHGTARVSVVHNGIIENHSALRQELEAAGQVFTSETDTETVAQLIDLHLQEGLDPLEASRAAFSRLEGAYSLAILFAGERMIVGVQQGAPLAIGRGMNEMFVGSDALALVPQTQHIAHLLDGDRVCVTQKGAQFFDESGATVVREFKLSGLNPESIGKGNYPHYMLKEITEHPRVIKATYINMIREGEKEVDLPQLGIDFASVERIVMSACGSAYWAAYTARTWFEGLAKLSVDADVASEFRYREPPLQKKGGLGLLVSQSGQTADTIAALQYMRKQ